MNETALSAQKTHKPMARVLLSMSMAVVIWARIITQNGKAMWALVIGSILMVAMHPIGGVYAVTAVFLRSPCHDPPGS